MAHDFCGGAAKNNGIDPGSTRGADNRVISLQIADIKGFTG
jgi:hypothetical protein